VSRRATCKRSIGFRHCPLRPSGPERLAIGSLEGTFSRRIWTRTLADRRKRADCHEYLINEQLGIYGPLNIHSPSPHPSASLTFSLSASLPLSLSVFRDERSLTFLEEIYVSVSIIDRGIRKERFTRLISDGRETMRAARVVAGDREPGITRKQINFGPTRLFVRESPSCCARAPPPGGGPS